MKKIFMALTFVVLIAASVWAAEEEIATSSSESETQTILEETGVDKSMEAPVKESVMEESMEAVVVAST